MPRRYTPAAAFPRRARPHQVARTSHSQSVWTLTQAHPFTWAIQTRIAGREGLSPNTCASWRSHIGPPRSSCAIRQDAWILSGRCSEIAPTPRFGRAGKPPVSSMAQPRRLDRAKI